MSGPPRCNRHDGPPCDALLDDPVAVLADPDRWPRHVCPDVALASVRAWAQARVVDIYGADGDVPEPVGAWATSYPLPVGRLSLPPGVPPGLAPLPGLGHATVILRTVPFFTEATVFGLVDPVDMVPVAMQRSMAGSSNDAHEVFIARAERWWSGQKATGRPRGREHTSGEARDAAIALFVRWDHWPKQGELAVALGISERTLRNVIGDYRAFLAEVQRYHAEVLRHSEHIRAVTPIVLARLDRHETTP